MLVADRRLRGAAGQVTAVDNDEHVDTYTQAIMDLGATLCTRSRPRCGDCPLSGDCVAFALDLVTRLPERKPKRAIPLEPSA